MKILLLGKDGQVGWELQRSLSILGEVIALGRHSHDLCGDLTCLDSLAETIQTVKPDVIVNAAAYTAVDRAETEPELADLINAKAVGVLAAEAARLKACLVHYSTDYVFDGSGNQPWCEDSAVAPLSVYGQSKLAGEQLIQQSGCKHLIFRTSWVYATRGANFAKTMFRLAKERRQIQVVSDQKGVPTSAELLADVTAHCIRFAQHNQQVSGLYHCVPSGETSWYEYAQFVIEQARQSGVRLMVQDILPVTTVQYPTPAARPLNSRLCSAKIEAVFGLKLPSWKQGVIRMLNEIVNEKNQ